MIFLEHDERVLDSENDLLIAPLPENEIKEAVWSCYAEGAVDRISSAVL